MGAKDLALAGRGSSGDVDRAVMAELKLEGFSPGFALLVEGVDLVLIDVNAVDAAAHKTVFMSVQRLEDFLNAMLLDDASVEGLHFFSLAATRPVGLFLIEPVV